MKYICIGKNYVSHAKEMGWGVPETPMFFFKPECAAPKTPGVFPYPKFSQDVHYELEIAVRMKAQLKEATDQEASASYDAVSLGIDFTCRDLQKQQKSLGFPWEICKSFDDSAPVGRWVPLETLGKPVDTLTFELRLDGEVKQRGYAGDMVFPVERLISHVSRYVTLYPGDILFTGTPEGIGPVKPGNRLEGYLEGEKLLSVIVELS